MYNSGDAAEQVVRMSLEGAEVASRLQAQPPKIWPPPFTRS